MAVSSIHFSAIKENSTSHNERKAELDYVYKDLSQDNESWKSHEVDEKLKEIQSSCKEISGRKLQKNAIPIREAVVNLNKHHTMDDLKRLSRHIEGHTGIECFQIHIHRDEGKSRLDLNYHAHMVFGWQDKKTGKMLRLNRTDMSKMQTLVAKSLDMERGELKVNSNRERLEPIEYKRQEEEKKLSLLKLEINDLEQKKNEADRTAQTQRAGAIKKLTENDIPTSRGAIREVREEDIVGAIKLVESQIERAEGRIKERSSKLNKVNGQIEQAKEATERARREPSKYKGPIHDLETRIRVYQRDVEKYAPYHPKD